MEGDRLVRRRRESRDGRRKSVTWSSEVIDEEKRRRSRSHASLPWYLVLLYVAIILLFSGLSVYLDGIMPEAVSDGLPNQFHASKARSHMEDITSLGIRHVGGKANEVHAKVLLVSKLEEIKKKASPKVNIEISVQTVSGTFFVDFLNGITHIYQNISNVVARISRNGSKAENAFMVNAHYDSALGTVAASDDAISCGIMLEALRCLSNDPDSLHSDNAIIFLFNGAEESVLQASHGFITQHPWASSIRAFLNLEAAGAGGKEIVFQTGPGHPWLARLYSKVVPYPHASVLAQEVFQSGIIPSDTDFRIFRDHGKIPGIDVAYFVNGYVYHTEYDVPSAIPDGSIQRAGENVLALLQAAVQSPHLSDTSLDSHGKNVFFDILGLLGVVYTESVAVVINIAMVMVVFVLMVFDLDWSTTDSSVRPTPKQLLAFVGVLGVSWIASVAAALAVGGVLTIAGRSMTWYAEPCLIAPLYVVPALLAMAGVHVAALEKFSESYTLQSIEKSSFLSIQLVWTVCLMILTCLRVCSAFIFLMAVVGHLLFRTILLEKIIAREIPPGHFMHRVAYTLCSACGSGLPGMLLLQVFGKMMQLFVPLMGRSGALLPSDMAIGGLVGILVALLLPYCVCVVVYSSSSRFKKWVGSLALLVFVLTLVAALGGHFKPYSMADPAFPRPKRLFLVHTDRRFHAMDGSISREDTQVFLYPFDYLGLATIAEEVPLFKMAEKVRCEGLYCGQPGFIPVIHLIDCYSLPADHYTNLQAPQVELVAMVKTSEQTKNFSFAVKFPPRSNAVLGLSEGLTLKAWSLESFIPAPNPCPGSYVNRGCYFILQSKGFGDGHFNFWLETQGVAKNSESLRLLMVAHYLDPPESLSPDLERVTKDMPAWVTDIGWAVSMDEWIF